MRLSVDMQRSCDGNGHMGMSLVLSLYAYLTVSSVCFPNDREVTPEAVAAKWKEITTFGEYMDHK